MRLPWNKYINPIQTHFCFPIRFKKRIHTAQSIDVNMIPVKLYFFCPLDKGDSNKEFGRQFADDSYFAKRYLTQC